MTMQEKFQEAADRCEFYDSIEGDFIPAKIKAFIGRAEIESNAKAQIEAYDNVRRLARGTSHKQYAEEQIDKLNKVIND